MKKLKSRKRYRTAPTFIWASLNRLLRRHTRVLRHDESTGAPPPLHWSPCHESTIHRFKATMACPMGHVLTLRSHIIRSDGTVTPSVVCPTEDCAFHAYVRLSNWTFGLIR